MKRKLMMVLGASLLIGVAGCSPKESTPPPADETPVQEPAEEGPQESPQVSEGNWLQEFMPEAPKLDGDMVMYKEEGPKKIFIELKGITYEQATSYVSSLKEAGFVENSHEEINENHIKYKGMDKSNNLIVFNWDKVEIAKLELIKK